LDYKGFTRSPLITKDVGTTQQELRWAKRGNEWGVVLVDLSAKSADGVSQCTPFGCDYSNDLCREECLGVLEGVSFSSYPALFLRGQSSLNTMARTRRCIERSLFCRCFRRRIVLVSQTSGSSNQCLYWAWMAAMTGGNEGHSKKMWRVNSGSKEC
jgi:hypothetical protein